MGFKKVEKNIINYQPPSNDSLRLVSGNTALVTVINQVVPLSGITNVGSGPGYFYKQTQNQIAEFRGLSAGTNLNVQYISSGDTVGVNLEDNIIVNSISATTLYSGSTDLSLLLGGGGSFTQQYVSGSTTGSESLISISPAGTGNIAGANSVVLSKNSSGFSTYSAIISGKDNLINSGADYSFISGKQNIISQPYAGGTFSQILGSNNKINGSYITIIGNYNSGYTSNSFLTGKLNLNQGTYFGIYQLLYNTYGLNNIAGSRNIIQNAGLSNIHNGFKNIIQNSTYSTLLNGTNSRIGQSSASLNFGINNNIYGSSYSIIIGGSNVIYTANTFNQQFNTIIGSTASVIKDVSKSAIFGGQLNGITGSTLTTIGQTGQNVILQGDNAKIQGSRSTIINGFNNFILDNSQDCTFVSGKDNTITGSENSLIFNGRGNNIVNSTGVTLINVNNITTSSSDSNLLITNKIKSVSLTGGSTQMVVADSTGLLSVQAIPSGLGATINNGINTFTAGTPNFQSVNVTALTINTLNVSGDTNLNTLSATTLQVRNLSGGGTLMVVTDNNGLLSTQSIPTSYPAKWIAGTAYSSVILNNGYTSSNSDYSLVAGKNTTINSNNPYSSILGGVENKIRDNSLASIIVGGQENYIRDYGKYTFIGAGRSNYVINAKHSVIPGGYGNRIYNNASNSESKYNSIINGYVNKINRGVNCTIIGSYNIIGNGELMIKYSFISGKNNRIYASYSNILGCYGVALSDNYTTLVNKLQIAGTQNVANNYLLNINPSDWKVNRTKLSGGTGIGITTAGGNLTITYTGSTSSLGGSSIVNGLNTYTAGTSSVQSVNISAATLNNLTVSGSTSLATVSATTIYSGSTDLSTLFQPKQTNYRQILASNYVYTSSTAVANFSFNVLAGEVYKAEMYSLFQVNNTGGMKLTLSGNALFNCVVRGNTSNLLTNSLRPVNSTGNTATLGVVSNTTLSYIFEGIISATTNTTIALGFSPQTNGQQITIFSGACMTLQKI